MSNITDLAILDNGRLPAHITSMFGDAKALNSDLMSGIGAGFPVLSYKGKVWTLVEGGTRTPLLNGDGDPRASLELVILASNPGMSKIYYANGYVEGSAEKPDCYSHDGVAPAPDAQAPQCNKCAICPMNQWGSKISENGSKIKACADAKRLAVAPVDELNHPALLRIPAGTLKDLRAYAEQLARRGVPVQAIVTKIGFDPTVAHQKLTFKPVRFLNEDEAAQVLEMKDSDIVQQIIGTQHVPEPSVEGDEIPGTPPANTVQRPAAAPRAVPRPTAAQQRAAAAKASEAEIAAALGEAPAEQPKPAATRQTARQAAAKPAPAPKVEEAQAEKPQSAAARTLAEIDASLDDVLASLDD